MRSRYVAVLAGLALAAGTGVVAPAVASAGTDHRQLRQCQREFDAAVHEDNDAYNAKDAARYEAILNPRMIFWNDGTATYGRDPIMATARASFAVPGWSWTYSIESETVYGCPSGIAVARPLHPARRQHRPGVRVHPDAGPRARQVHGRDRQRAPAAGLTDLRR
jgi:hypothetical protein